MTSIFVQDIKLGENIPKIIHQTYFSRDLPSDLQENVKNLIAQNPEWDYRFYDDNDIVAFIQAHYGSDVLSIYNRINPKYGAAKADFFRYLLMYKIGGVYLDIKSNFNGPIDAVLLPNDKYILAGWCNEDGEQYEGFGKWPELKHLPNGEFQQWHIICVPGHPFLKSVINSIISNTQKYKPWKNGVGGKGVLNLTGPIAYTLAIDPIKSMHPHRYIRRHSELKLVYSTLENKSHRNVYTRPHYKIISETLILHDGAMHYIVNTYTRTRDIYLTAKQNLKYFVKKLIKRPRA